VQALRQCHQKGRYNFCIGAVQEKAEIDDDLFPN
jgi:hypothetical protein